MTGTAMPCGSARLRWLLAAVVAILVVAPPLTAGAAPLPRPDQGDPVAPAGAVAFVGLDQTPYVGRDGTWTVSLGIGQVPVGAVLEADVHARIDDRADLGPTYFGVVEGGRLASLPDVELDAVPITDGLRRVDLAVTLRQEAPRTMPGWAFLSAGLRPGVYPVVVRVLDADGETIGSTVLLLSRVPDAEEAGGGSQALVAPLITLASTPTVDADGREHPDPDLTDRVEALSSGLALAGEIPFTLVPRPESVEALARSEEGAAALDRLARLPGHRQVIDGPYVDVPTAAWIDRGMGDELTRQRERGTTVLSEHLGRTDASVWDGRSGTTPATLSALWPVGVRTVLLGPEAITDDDVPSGPVTIDVGAGRVADAVVLDRALTTATAWRGDPVLDAATVAAELTLIAGTANDEAPAIVLATPDDWPTDPAAVSNLAKVLTDPAAPVQAVTLDGLLEQSPTGAAAELAPILLADLGDHPDQLDHARRRLASMASMTGATDPEVGALDQRLLLSGDRGLAPSDRTAYVESVTATAEHRFGQVRAPDRQTVTLTSNDGEVPLTLVNEMDVPVQVVVELEADSRVDVAEPRVTATLPAGSTTPLSIPVHTRAPGDTAIDVTVRTPDGAVLLGEVRYTIRSTAVPGIGLALSAGAVLFLLAWWVRHWLRHRGSGTDGPDTSVAGAT